LHEWGDHGTIDDAIEKAALQGCEIKRSAQTFRRQFLDIAANLRWSPANRVFYSVQVVQDVRRTQELQQPEASVSSQVDEGNCVPTDGNFDNDDSNLGERRVRQ